MSATLTDIKIECAGRWSSVLMNIGIEAEYLNGRHGPCPVCGGKDRFRWDRKKEIAFCSGCGHKSPLDLAIAYLGRPFRETAAEIRSILGVTTMEPVKQGGTDEEIKKNKARLQAIHKGLSSLSGSCIGSAYIASRGISVLPEKDCYFNPAVPYYEDGTKQGDFPALVSVFRGVTGETATYHITYLNGDGKAKRSCASPKKILPTIRPLTGCSIQLFSPVNGVLAVAEGIETALAVHQDQGLPVWAAGNAVNMAAMQVPADVNEVWIFSDMDFTFTGQQAAYTLAKRLKNEGKIVRVVVLIDNKQHTDVGNGGDFLDHILTAPFGISAQ